MFPEIVDWSSCCDISLSSLFSQWCQNYWHDHRMSQCLHFHYNTGEVVREVWFLSSELGQCSLGTSLENVEYKLLCSICKIGKYTGSEIITNSLKLGKARQMWTSLFYSLGPGLYIWCNTCLRSQSRHACFCFLLLMLFFQLWHEQSYAGFRIRIWAPLEIYSSELNYNAATEL